ncbi:MAG: hypothetical protein H7326_11590 [Bdellovibrionaceae bacterium]|nr:hypothetical protein [Pseudobdellovibrionaceae bacterium]
MLEFNIRLPLDYDLPTLAFRKLKPNPIQVKLVSAPAEFAVELSRDVEYLNGAWIEITVNLPKLKPRKILTQVKPGMSTLVQTELTYDR